jgi:hypothetical protein
VEAEGSQSGITLSLGIDTVNDGRGVPEYTALISNDTLFVIDHVRDRVRGLVHFAHKVCAIRPKTIVLTTGAGNDETHTVQHAPSVYVRTKSGAESAETCEGDAGQFFYEVPLNYNGFAEADNPEFSNELYNIRASEYNAELVFGWVDDDFAGGTATDRKLDHGFLGYDPATLRLEFFSPARTLVWSQPRRTERFPVSTAEDADHQRWFRVEPLAQQQYLVELGRDVFVVDAGTMLFERAPTEVPDILSDRIYQRDARTDGLFPSNFRTIHNDQDLILIDQFKIFRHAYAPASAPETSRAFGIVPLPGLGHGQERYEDKYAFNQLALRSCSLSTLFEDADQCRLANFNQSADPDAWQFATACEADLGCSLPVDDTDYCTTPAEFILSQDDDNLCTTREFAHLNELNDPGNDAQFRGFIQYGPDYVRGMDLLLDEQSLFVTLRLNERDVLVRFFYDLDLSLPKLARERVLFGRRLAHAGLEAYLNQGNLFVSTLTNVAGNVSMSQFYNTVDFRIRTDACEADELVLGTCTDRYYLYEARALFCTAAQMTAGDCADSGIVPADSLSVQAPGAFGTWLPLLDSSAGDGSVASSMYLLQSDSIADEGVLIQPTLHAVDNGSGVADLLNPVGQVPGPVESVHHGWRQGTGYDRLDLIRTELDFSVGAEPDHALTSIYVVLNPDTAAAQVTASASKSYPRRQ